MRVSAFEGLHLAAGLGELEISSVPQDETADEIMANALLQKLIFFFWKVLNSHLMSAEC